MRNIFYQVIYIHLPPCAEPGGETNSTQAVRQSTAAARPVLMRCFVRLRWIKWNGHLARDAPPCALVVRGAVAGPRPASMREELRLFEKVFNLCIFVA